MNIKRDMGVYRIFLLSCGIAAALAVLLWLAEGIACALTVADAAGGGSTMYTKSVSDIDTPWLMLAAGMFTYHRFWRMCSANSVSPKKQALCLAGISPIFSALFACADIAFVKGFLERIYGKPVRLSLESWGSYFDNQFYREFYDGSVAEANAVYPARIMFLLFAVTAVYYCTFFLSGCYIMACIDSGRIRRSVYYLVTSPLGTFWFFPLTLPLICAPYALLDSELSLEIFYCIAFTAACLTGFFSSPAVFSYWLAKITLTYEPVWYLIFAAVFIFMTLISIEHAALNPDAKTEKTTHPFSSPQKQIKGGTYQ